LSRRTREAAKAEFTARTPRGLKFRLTGKQTNARTYNDMA